MLGFHRALHPSSIKLYQCSILLGDWKHEFCCGSGRTILNAKTDSEDEAPTFRPPYLKSQLIGGDPDAGKDCWQKERCQKDEMMRWYHRINGHEIEETPQNSKRQGSLFCCRRCNHKVSNMTASEQYHWGHRVQ